MRIGLYLATSPSDGGVYQYSITMLDAVLSLPRGSYQSTVVYADEVWREQLQTLPVDKVFLPRSVYTRVLGRSTRENLLSIATLRRLSSFIHPTIRFLQSKHCDLWIFPAQDPLSYHGEIPALVAVHDLMHRYETRFPEVSANGQFEWREMHYRNICRYARGILVDSEVGRQQLLESYRVDSAKVHILPFVAPRYIFDSVPSTDFDSKYRLPKEFIFYPAQFWEHKNHKNLIRAVNLLKDAIKDLQLVLVGGKKNGYESVRKLVVELQLQDRIHFVGFVPDQDIPEFYRRAKAMVMPTFFGPTNILPLEAFALGCPCAVSDVYGMKQQVGDAALLFDPSKVEDIARAVERLWLDHDVRRMLIERGRKRVQAWNQEHFNRRLVEIIDRMELGEK